MFSKLVAVLAFSLSCHVVTAWNISWQWDAQALLNQTLTGIGDVGSTLASTRVNKTIYDTKPSVGRPSALSNVLQNGTFPIANNKRFQAEGYYITLFCVCEDEKCTVQSAADRHGVTQVDATYSRSSPLFLLDADASKMDCLSIVERDLQELRFLGCEQVTKGSEGGFHLQNCSERSLTKLEVLESGSSRLIARPYNEDELRPDEVWRNFSASLTLQEVYGNVFNASQILQEVFGNATDLDTRSREGIGKILSTASRNLVLGMIDRIASTLLPQNFTQDAPARNATFMDFFYLLMSSSLSRLDRLVAPFEKISNSTLAGDAVYVSLVAGQPDPMSLPDVLSGVTVLLMVSTGFGCSLSTQPLLPVQVLGAFLVFATEVTAFVLRLKDSVELHRWEEHMILVYTQASSRNYAIALNKGFDGSGLAVTVVFVKLTNTGTAYIPLQIAGAILAVAFFFVGLYWGRDPTHCGTAPPPDVPKTLLKTASGDTDPADSECSIVRSYTGSSDTSFYESHFDDESALPDDDAAAALPVDESPGIKVKCL